MAFQHEAAVKDLKQAALDAEREFAAKEITLRGKESHLEDALKARWGRKTLSSRLCLACVAHALWVFAS